MTGMANRKTTMAAVAGLLLAMTGAGFLGPVQGQEKRSLESVYKNGVALYEAGKYAEALSEFQTVIKASPRYAPARSYAAKCELAIKQGGGPKETLEAKLGQIQVPAVEFQDTPLHSVFEYLTKKSEELSGGKVIANFIYKGSEEDRQKTLVTLRLNNVPMTEVIRYVGQLSATKFSYEEFAVLGTPLSQVPVTAAAPTQTAENAARGFDPPASQAGGNDPFRKK